MLEKEGYVYSTQSHSQTCTLLRLSRAGSHLDSLRLLLSCGATVATHVHATYKLNLMNTTVYLETATAVVRPIRPLTHQHKTCNRASPKPTLTTRSPKDSNRITETFVYILTQLLIPLAAAESLSELTAVHNITVPSPPRSVLAAPHTCLPT
jgi:hypothetical protein